MSHPVPSPRRRTLVIPALHVSLPVTRKARAAVAADALDAPGAPAKQPPRQPPAATLTVAGEGNAWVELDVTALAQTWVSDASQNHGLVLLQEAASGSVVYSFCSEVAQAPATPTPPYLAGHAPKLTLRYHLTEPAPLKATFQRGANGYTGNVATYFDGSGNGYNASTYLRVSADGSQKSLLRFDVSSIPITDTIDMATLRDVPGEPQQRQRSDPGRARRARRLDR